jgi:dolichol-phosphate mannosyltransferase
MHTFVLRPTYNEKENIETLVKDILNLGIEDISVVVADDNSPDGTWEIVERMSREDPRVHLLKRMKRHGRGFAGIDGFLYCFRQGADYIVEMDGDFSHDPKHIPEMLREIDSCDVVIGSRFIKGGSDNDRSIYRTILTRLVALYVRTLLGVKVRDVSSGYKLFKRKVFEKIDLEDMISTGPSVVLETLYKLTLSGFKIKEVPIRFVDRKLGSTKLDIITLLETMVMVLKLRKWKKLGRLDRQDMVRQE